MHATYAPRGESYGATRMCYEIISFKNIVSIAPVSYYRW